MFMLFIHKKWKYCIALNIFARRNKNYIWKYTSIPNQAQIAPELFRIFEWYHCNFHLFNAIFRPIVVAFLSKLNRKTDEIFFPFALYHLPLHVPEDGLFFLDCVIFEQVNALTAFYSIDVIWYKWIVCENNWGGYNDFC